MKSKVTLMDPSQRDQVLRVQFQIPPGGLQNRVISLMAKYSMDQGAICRMLLVQAIEAIDGQQKKLA